MIEDFGSIKELPYLLTVLYFSHLEHYALGDKAYKDKDGYFYFVGRSDDVILSAGLVA